MELNDHFDKSFVADENKIMVSVICTTYNHEKYIRDALESFLCQRTTFQFEVLVMDDASTDNTAKIIREIEIQHPEIIKPIYQKENIYSRKISKIGFYKEIARGKYVALCEGDDYWTDQNKLQKQFDYMEANPNCTLCIHNSLIVNENRDVIGKIDISDSGERISADTVILGGGGFCATSSIFTKAGLYFNRPDYFNILSIDYILQIYLASKGETYCFGDYMSAYRKEVAGSWTAKMKKGFLRENMVDHLKKVNEACRMFDKDTSYQYHSAACECEKRRDFQIMELSGDISLFKNKNLQEYVKAMPLKQRVAVLVRFIIKFFKKDKTV